MIYAGNPCPLVRTREGWSRQSGFYTEKEWEGPQASMYGMVGEIQASSNPPDSYDIEYDTGSAKWRLRARFAKQQGDGQVEVPTDEVRIQYVAHPESVFKLPRYSGINSKSIMLLKFSIQNPTDPKSVFANLAAGQSPAIFVDPLVQELFFLLRIGVEHVDQFVPVIERRRIASATYDFKSFCDAAYLNVGSIISVGSIAADATLPNPQLFTLPAGGPSVNFNDEELGIENALTANFGWLKNGPEYSQTSQNKTMLSQTWQYGLWVRQVYGAPI